MNREAQSNNVVWHHATVTPQRREQLNGHRAVVVWFTGLSGAGKSTLAHAVEEALHVQGRRTFVFDGDNVRHGLCADLGFSPADRRENLRRIGEMARLFVDAGVIALTAFISPMRADRERVRQIVGPARFVEVFVSCPLEVCEQRDVKGMYRRARAGEIPEFTGVSAPYEAPEAPALVVDTSTMSLAQSVDLVLELLHAAHLPVPDETPPTAA
ncbi:MAG: adenylyl-sulfate kinase [Rhodocyclaceae bacterium]|nr:adenylyl-sulfate kinase [Rhodocyclaceae bacterium]